MQLPYQPDMSKHYFSAADQIGQALNEAAIARIVPMVMGEEWKQRQAAGEMALSAGDRIDIEKLALDREELALRQENQRVNRVLKALGLTINPVTGGMPPGALNKLNEIAGINTMNSLPPNSPQPAAGLNTFEPSRGGTQNIMSAEQWNNLLNRYHNNMDGQQ